MTVSRDELVGKIDALLAHFHLHDPGGMTEQQMDQAMDAEDEAMCGHIPHSPQRARCTAEASYQWLKRRGVTVTTDLPRKEIT